MQCSDAASSHKTSRMAKTAENNISKLNFDQIWIKPCNNSWSIDNFLDCRALSYYNAEGAYTILYLHYGVMFVLSTSSTSSRRNEAFIRRTCVIDVYYFLSTPELHGLLPPSFSWPQASEHDKRADERKKVDVNRQWDRLYRRGVK